MEIRPHRRLVVPFESPHFSDLISVSEFVSFQYEHFGVAKFSSELFAYTSVPVLRRMCDSLGLKLMIDCVENCDADSLVGADYVVIPPSRITSCRPERARLLVRCAGEQDAIIAACHPVSGIACDSSFVAEAKRGLQGEPLILSLSGDPVAAVKAGASLAVVGPDVFGAKDPGVSLRNLAEEFRGHT